MEIGKVIRSARLSAGVTLKSVEAATGIAASVQSKIELGDIPSPSFSAIARLARFYNLSMEGIFEASETGADSPMVAAKASLCRHVPIISYCQAGDWGESVPQEHDFEVIASPFKCSEQAFALEVKGTSMTAPPGAECSFTEGSYVIVEPGMEARHKSFVIARIEGTNEVTFKRLMKDGGMFLQPLNPQFPVIPIDQPIHICGVVIGSVQKISW